MENRLTSYPLIFSFRDAVAGEGFLACVTISGRARMVKEDGKWWVYGVAPGALAENGSEPLAAHAAFRDAYRKVLYDLAADAETFEGFKELVEGFCRPDDAEQALWFEAAEAIRSGKVTPEPPFSELPRVNADARKCTVMVERLDQPQRIFSTKDNELDEYAITVAAAAA